MIEPVSLRDVVGVVALSAAAAFGARVLVRRPRRRPPALVRQAARLARREVRRRHWLAWTGALQSLVLHPHQQSEPGGDEPRLRTRSW